MEGFTPILSLVGGVLIGLASVALLFFKGRIAGVSGIIGGILAPHGGDVLWRIVFIAGLIAGGAMVLWFYPEAMQIRVDVSTTAVILGGLLVGLGTRMGSGCTSGHGVCGIGRLAPRSLIATGVFFAAAVFTVYVVRHVLGDI